MTDALDKELLAGRDAQYLLEHPTFVEALTKIRAEITDQWSASPARDTDGRERLWVMLKLLDRLEGHIKTVAETGKLAAKQIADIEAKRRLFGVL